MPEINDSTPRRKIQIGGVVLQAPTPYSAGHVLNDNEAAAINQTYLENVGNNFRSAVTKAKKLAILGNAEATPEQIKTVTDAQLKTFDSNLEDDTFAGSFVIDADLQTKLDALVSEYQMGVRRSSSVEVLSPVEREARGMAKTILKGALQKKNIKLNTVSADWYDREIAKLLDKDSPKMIGERNRTAEIWAAAEEAVAARKNVASDTLDELDMEGVEKEAEAETEAETTETTETQE